MLAAAMLLSGGPAAAQVPGLEIRIRGAPEPLEQNIRATLSLVREQGRERLDARRLRLLHRHAPEEIRRALEPFGYYQSQVQSSLEQNEAGVWVATYNVTVGPVIRVSQVSLNIEGEGIHDPALQQWRQEFPLAKGDPLRHQLYEQAKDALLRLAQDRGYLKAKLLAHEVRVNVSRSSAEIDLAIDTGPRYRFGEVRFSKVPLRESLLRRYLTFEPGDPYDADRIFDFQSALADSDYFSRSEVVPQFDQAEMGRIPIEVVLEMRSRDRYAAGVGYGTDTGPRIRLGAERRWANSRGHRYGAEATVSQVYNELTTFYRIPLKEARTDYLAFNSSWEREETDTLLRETTSVSSGYTQLLRQWHRTLTLNYRRELFDVGTTSDESRMLYPELSFDRVEASESRIFPRSGWRAVAGVRVASADAISSTNLLQGELRGKFVFPVLGGRLISRGDLALSEVSDFDRLPVSLRFFAGGDFSVRGYAYKSLGPEDESGEVIGGKHLLVGSIEYDRYPFEKFGMAAFVDAGNAFNTVSFDLNYGAGFGLRYRFPFGQLRVDLASAVSEPNQPWRLHISIGPDL